MTDPSIYEMTADELEEALFKARNALGEKQVIFLDHYRLDENGKAAAMRAGYSEKTAESQASRLLRSVKVSLVRDLEKERLRRSKNIDIEWLLNQHLDNLSLSRKAGNPIAVDRSLDSISKLLDLYPDAKSTLEIKTGVAMTDIDDDYWAALVADVDRQNADKTKH